MLTTTAKIGKGKAVHAMVTTGGLTGMTLCALNRNDWTRTEATECDAAEVTCKHCLRELADLIEQAHGEAIAEDAERAMTVVQIEVRDLRETDVIVLNPAATPVHVVRREALEITRQKYGITYTATWVMDGEAYGRRRGCMRYTDRVWVERTA